MSVIEFEFHVVLIAIKLMGENHHVAHWKHFSNIEMFKIIQKILWNILNYAYFFAANMTSQTTRRQGLMQMLFMQVDVRDHVVINLMFSLLITIDTAKQHSCPIEAQASGESSIEGHHFRIREPFLQLKNDPRIWSFCLYISSAGILSMWTCNWYIQCQGASPRLHAYHVSILATELQLSIAYSFLKV